MSKIFSKTELDMSLCQIGNVSKTVMLYGWKILKVLLYIIKIINVALLNNVRLHFTKNKKQYSNTSN